MWHTIENGLKINVKCANFNFRSRKPTAGDFIRWILFSDSDYSQITILRTFYWKWSTKCHIFVLHASSISKIDSKHQEYTVRDQDLQHFTFDKNTKSSSAGFNRLEYIYMLFEIVFPHQRPRIFSSEWLWRKERCP